MIIEYHRPETIQEALRLLSRSVPRTVPLGGGGGISQGYAEPVAVVDLQNLNLNTLERSGNQIVIGATATLQSMVNWTQLPPKLREIIEYEFTINSRNIATLAGSILRADHRSSLAAALLAVNSHLSWEPGGEEISMGDWIPVRNVWRGGRIIRSIQFIYPKHFRFEKISRTPKDLPIISAALAEWPNGRRRLVLGGYGDYPMCVFDGMDAGGLVEAAINARSHYPFNNLSNTYINNMIHALIKRLT